MLLISKFCDPSVKGSVNSVEEVSTYTIQRILHTQIFRTATPNYERFVWLQLHYQWWRHVFWCFSHTWVILKTNHLYCVFSLNLDYFWFLSSVSSSRFQTVLKISTVKKYGRGGAPGLATYLRIGSNLEIL